ncbi:MAG TPA: NAD(P)-dependent oxidoreductase [Actinomycetota bacterium]|nr:NAD(P)-dependent oxidoreductase [Actinomycetota bacterium]
MRVFVAGAAGVIGRRLLPMLVEAGHDVTGTTRRDDRVEWIRSRGAVPVQLDVFDADALSDAVVAAKPDVVVHELTDIPQSIDPKRYAEQMAGNNRIRIEGTRNLVAAAKAAGARRLVAQSIAFAYRPEGGDIRDEEDPLYLDAPEPMGATIVALAELESQVLEAGAPEGVVLRYGYFYGPGTVYASDGSTAARVRKHRFPVVGAGNGIFSFVHVDDAAAATVLALDHGEPGIYNVVDDEPSPVSEWLPEYARVLGAKSPGTVPIWLARAAGGGRTVHIMEDLRGASNHKARTGLGWTPMYPSWREGFREGLG